MLTTKPLICEHTEWNLIPILIFSLPAVIVFDLATCANHYQFAHLCSPTMICIARFSVSNLSVSTITIVQIERWIIQFNILADIET